MDTTVLVAVVGGGSAIVAAGVTGLVAWAVASRQVKPQEITASAAVQDAINEGFAKLAAQYEAMNTELKASNEALTAQVKEQSEQVEQLTGEVRDLTQHVESLENALRREGLPVPARRKYPHPMAKPPLVALPSPPEAK